MFVHDVLENISELLFIDSKLSFNLFPVQPKLQFVLEPFIDRLSIGDMLVFKVLMDMHP
jgi:hypothetical protein